MSTPKSTGPTPSGRVEEMKDEITKLLEDLQFFVEIDGSAVVDQRGLAVIADLKNQREILLGVDHTSSRAIRGLQETITRLHAKLAVAREGIAEHRKELEAVTLRLSSKLAIARDCLERVNAGCSFPSNDVEKAIRDTTKTALAALKDP